MATSPNTTVSNEPTSRIALSKIAVGTIVGALAAAAVNAVVFFIADAAGSFPEDVLVESPGGDLAPIGVGTVILATIFQLVVAGIVFAVISRFSARPIRLFWYVAMVVLVLSFALPFTISDAPGDMIVALLLMHLLAAVIGVGIMTRVART